ncbi:MAG: hypothetical protein U0457_06320 [Candidatus Sericytochromatia bacterium]
MKNPFFALVEKTGSKKLAEILNKMGVMDNTHLETVLNSKIDTPNKDIKEIIIEKGFATKEQVNQALDEQRKDNRLGQLLVFSKIINKSQLEEALSEHEITKEKLGTILVKKGYCTDFQIENALKFQKKDNRLGTVLLREGYITEEQLDLAIAEQEKTGKLLGETLTSMGFINDKQLNQALIKQVR